MKSKIEVGNNLSKLIQAIPVGKENAIGAPELELRLGHVAGIGTNNDSTRGDVQDAIYIHKIPIASTPRDGYWLIDTETEFQEAMEKIERTIMKYKRKKEAIRAGWERRKASIEAGNPWPK